MLGFRCLPGPLTTRRPDLPTNRPWPIGSLVKVLGTWGRMGSVVPMGLMPMCPWIVGANTHLGLLECTPGLLNYPLIF
jgi:hypothetical protein